MCEEALFINKDTAKRIALRAMNSGAVQTASVQPRFVRGAMQGYWVCVKFLDGVVASMSEDYAERLGA